MDPAKSYAKYRVGSEHFAIDIFRTKIKSELKGNAKPTLKLGTKNAESELQLGTITSAPKHADYELQLGTDNAEPESNQKNAELGTISVEPGSNLSTKNTKPNNSKETAIKLDINNTKQEKKSAENIEEDIVANLIIRTAQKTDTLKFNVSSKLVKVKSGTDTEKITDKAEINSRSSPDEGLKNNVPKLGASSVTNISASNMDADVVLGNAVPRLDKDTSLENDVSLSNKPDADTLLKKIGTEKIAGKGVLDSKSANTDSTVSDLPQSVFVNIPLDKALPKLKLNKDKVMDILKLAARDVYDDHSYCIRNPKRIKTVPNKKYKQLPEYIPETGKCGSPRFNDTNSENVPVKRKISGIPIHVISKKSKLSILEECLRTPQLKPFPVKDKQNNVTQPMRDIIDEKVNLNTDRICRVCFNVTEPKNSVTKEVKKLVTTVMPSMEKYIYEKHFLCDDCVKDVRSALLFQHRCNRAVKIFNGVILPKYDREEMKIQNKFLAILDPVGDDLKTNPQPFITPLPQPFSSPKPQPLTPPKSFIWAGAMQKLKNRFALLARPNVKCPKCETVMPVPTFMNGHILKCGVQVLDLELRTCKECNVIVDSTTYKMHLRTHKRPVCKYCKDVLRNSLELKVHIEQKHATVVCPKCPRKFETEELLSVHNYKHHQCEKCGKIFIRQRYLQRHVDVHTEAATCTECKTVFANKHLLRRHNYQHHKSGPSAACEICGKVVGLKGMALHKAKHNKADCPICKKKISIKTLEQHVKSCTDYTSSSRKKDIKCGICEGIFESKSLLAIHMKRYHSEMTVVQKFSCNVCDKRFASKAFLERHVINTIQ